MRRKSVGVLGVAAVAFCLVTVCRSESPDAGGDKIALRVLYIGSPGTSREKDFVGFLEKHFTKVGKGSVEEFHEERADGFDVVIVRMPGLRVSSKYTRPTMTLAAPGASVCGRLGLKAGHG